jgi:hypothetical protein
MNLKIIKFFTMGKKNSSPTDQSRGCLCKDGTYKKECCNGEIQEQGIGALVEQSTSTIVNTNEPRTIVRSNG